MVFVDTVAPAAVYGGSTSLISSVQLLTATTSPSPLTDTQSYPRGVAIPTGRFSRPFPTPPTRIPSGPAVREEAGQRAKCAVLNSVLNSPGQRATSVAVT
jgi:hypothetical protein